MLDDRKSAILRAVVEEYIDTAQPVGSAHVVRAATVAVSSATIRHEMSVLEREGYLVQPHTSAGRIPTDKGYRFFVDQLAGHGKLDASKRQLVREFFDTAHGELEQMLHDTTRLLSKLTDYAAVVVRQPDEAVTVRSLQLVGLTPHVALAVVVLSNGAIEKRTIELAPGADEAVLAAASARLAAALIGHTLADPGPLVAGGDEVTDAVVASTAAALADGGRDDDGGRVFMGGVSRMASAFDAVEVVRQVLVTLEQQFVVVSLLRDVLESGLSVAIGAEHGLADLASCAVVVSPFAAPGTGRGTIGIVGPTRMHYPQALAAVALVSQRLGRRLAEG
ncbi:MAG: heat-inducible transcriptional repressor HrcA [Acidimicrobiales bacterium]